ncbi:hypothetical protein [Actinomadura pelletieri]|nr:hypothetical protein [Actinomadura pelletieri]
MSHREVSEPPELRVVVTIDHGHDAMLARVHLMRQRRRVLSLYLKAS